MHIKNDTPFEFMALPNYDKDGLEVFTNIVKGTFTITDNRAIAVADTQVPVVTADAYWGETGTSPLRYESDLALYKPSSDLILLGSAHPYAGGKISEMEIVFAVGHRKKKATVKSGQSMAQIPLHAMDYSGPGLSHFTQQGSGVGFYPKQYKPRVDYAGTYDDAWRNERFPFLPKDFDYRFFQAAYPDLVHEPYLRGNEAVIAENVSPSGPIRFNLPGIRIDVETLFEKKSVALTSVLDTVILEPDERRLLLIWRQMVPCQGMIQRVKGFAVKMTGP